MCIYMHILGIYKKQTNIEKKKDKQRDRNSMKSNHGTAPVLHSRYNGLEIPCAVSLAIFSRTPHPSPSACRETYGKEV